MPASKTKMGLIISLSVFSAFSLADTQKLTIEGGCNYFGKNLIGQQVTLFDPDPQAVDLIERIAKVEGLRQKNFTIKAAAVDNATAIIENNARYILYNQLFLRESKEKMGGGGNFSP